jgi:hypothetical protein
MESQGAREMTVTDGKRALIFGISGQDGALLARLLID